MEPESQALKWESGWGVSYRAPTDAPGRCPLGQAGRDPGALTVLQPWRAEKTEELSSESGSGSLWASVSPFVNLASSVSFCNIPTAMVRHRLIPRGTWAMSVP